MVRSRSRVLLEFREISASPYKYDTVAENWAKNEA